MMKLSQLSSLIGSKLDYFAQIKKSGYQLSTMRENRC